MVSLCKLGTELWGKGQSFGGDPQQDRETEMEIRERERDRRDGREGDTPFGRECDCLMKTAEPTKPKHSALFKAVVLRLRSCPSDAGTLVLRITFKANFYFSFCFCFWQNVGVNQVDH